MKEFNQSVLGGYNLGHFAGFFFWALIGAYLLMQFNATKRDVKSDRTPEGFSWRFWIKDNARRITFNVVLILVVIRFSKQVTGREVDEFWSLVIGLSSDGLAWLLSKFKIWKLFGTFNEETRPTDLRKEIEQELQKREAKQ